MIRVRAMKLQKVRGSHNQRKRVIQADDSGTSIFPAHHTKFAQQLAGGHLVEPVAGQGASIADPRPESLKEGFRIIGEPCCFLQSFD